jgi:hypothetical protein
MAFEDKHSTFLVIVTSAAFPPTGIHDTHMSLFLNLSKLFAKNPPLSALLGAGLPGTNDSNALFNHYDSCFQ